MNTNTQDDKIEEENMALIHFKRNEIQLKSYFEFLELILFELISKNHL